MCIRDSLHPHAPLSPTLMPRARHPDVAALLPPLQPSFVRRLGRRLHARGRELLEEQPALDAASIAVSDFAA
eukprot:8424272-Alexandrium_andersonii.AAC.1